MRATERESNPLSLDGLTSIVFGNLKDCKLEVNGTTIAIFVSVSAKTMTGLVPIYSCPSTEGNSTNQISPFFIMTSQNSLTLRHLKGPILSFPV